jgi:hypothetical protein
MSYCEQLCKSLCLAGMVDNKIFRRKFPWVRGSTAITEGVFITYGGLKKERSNTGLYGLTATNMSVVVAYPAQITIVRGSNQDLEQQGDWLAWSEQAAQGFTPATQPAAPGLDWVETIMVEDGPILDAGSFMAQWDVQALIVKAVGRERRGQVT